MHKMPWFKVWNMQRDVKKSVKADSLDELKQKGICWSWYLCMEPYKYKVIIAVSEMFLSIVWWLQCFDAVGWAIGRSSGLQKTSGGMLAWLCVWVKVPIWIWPSWCHCHSLSLFLVNHIGFTFLVFLSGGCWLTRVVPDKIQEVH